MTATPDVNDPLWRPASLQYEKLATLHNPEARRLANYWWAYFLLQDQLPDPPSGHRRNVLDLGSGSGYGTKILSLCEKAAVTGFETDENALSMARGSYPKLAFNRVNLDVDWATMAGTPDVIVAFHVFEEIEHRDMFLLDVSRIMRDNGMLLLALNDPKLVTERFPANPRAKLEYSVRDVIRLLSRFFTTIATGVNLPHRIAGDLQRQLGWGKNVIYCANPRPEPKDEI